MRGRWSCQDSCHHGGDCVLTQTGFHNTCPRVFAPRFQGGVDWRECVFERDSVISNRYDKDQGLSADRVQAARKADALPTMNQPMGPARHALRLHVLASGSAGNAAVVENAATGRGVLIDCGICKRDFFARCQEAGFDPANLDAILVTHDHSDHTKGIGVVLRGLAKQGVRLPLYTAPQVVDASKPLREAVQTGLADFVPFSAGSALSLAGCQIHVLRSSHDAAASFGFRVEAPDLPSTLEGLASGDRAASGVFAPVDVLGYLTDSGVVTPQCHEGLGGARILALESNHDPRMLKEGPYPYHIKQRVASDVGHLSNGQAQQELASLLHGGLEQVVAMHVSRNNNTYRLPLEVHRALLSEHCHGAQVSVAYQDRLVSVV